jgi:putative tryptophan/tyrosine transport system substrate-binding protein
MYKAIKNFTATEFLVGIVLLFLLNCAPQAVFARPLIAFLVQAQIPDSGKPALVEGIEMALKQKGRESGKDYDIEVFSFNNNRESLPGIAKIILDRKPSAVYVTSAYGAQALRGVTTTIPIVFGIPADPALYQLTNAEAKTDWNLTGFTEYANLIGKNIEILKRIFPKTTTIALLHADTIRGARMAEYNTLERELGVKLVYILIKRPEDTAELNARISELQADAAVIFNDSSLTLSPKAYARMARLISVPSIVNYRGMVELGAPIHHFASIRDRFEVAAEYLQKIVFQSQKPSALPILGPNHFDLAVNLGAAKERAWIIPNAMLGAVRFVD